MNITCEFFLDYVYEEDIAIEMFNPAKAIVNAIERLISVFQRLINNFRKLRSVTVPKKAVTMFTAIANEYNKANDISNSKIVSKTVEELEKSEEALNAAQRIDDIVEKILNSKTYDDFINMPAKDPDLPGSAYKEQDSREMVDNLNKAIKNMAAIRHMAKATLVEPGPNTKKILNSVVRLYNVKIRAYNKFLSFKKVTKEPSGEKMLFVEKEYTPEFFMDDLYDEDDIAIEMINPITEIVSLVERVMSILQRLVNNFRKLGKITVPVRGLSLFNTINNELNKGTQFINGSFTNFNFKDPKNADAVANDAQNLDNITDRIENHKLYKEYMEMPAKDSNLKGSDYAEADSNGAINILNNDIKFMARFRAIAKSTMNEKKIDQNIRKALRSAVRFLQLRIKVYNKLLAFRKVTKDEAEGKFNVTPR